MLCSPPSCITRTAFRSAELLLHHVSSLMPQIIVYIWTAKLNWQELDGANYLDDQALCRRCYWTCFLRMDGCYGQVRFSWQSHPYGAPARPRGGNANTGGMTAMVRSDSRGSHTNTGLQPGLVVAMRLRCSCCLCDGKRCQDPQGGGKHHPETIARGRRGEAEQPFGDQQMLIETPRPRLNNSDRLKSRDVWQVWSH